MLDSPIKLGAEISRYMGEWDDILDKPSLENKKTNGEEVKGFIIPIVFNLDKHAVEIDPRNFLEYDPEKSFREYFNVKIQGGNNKAVYTCVERKKLEQIRKTFFGIGQKDEDSDASKGQFMEAIEKDFPELISTALYEVLQEILSVREDFEERYANDAKKIPEDGDKLLLKSVTLDANSQIALVPVAVIWSEKGWDSPVFFRDIPGYLDFLRLKFFKNSSVGAEREPDPSERLCYASGKMSADVGLVEVANRYSLNKMFVTTTRNYASAFNAADFQKNYQVDRNVLLHLERGSKYLLENVKTRIAGVDHCIIPQVFSKDTSVELERTLKRLQSQSDLLFQFKKFQDITEDLQDEVFFPYWITFLGFESDGNFFKTISIIKDVSRTYFESLIVAFGETNQWMKEIPGVNWNDVMTIGKDRQPIVFNLFTVYGLIPHRKDKEKKNEALNLFRQILEKRPIERQKLFAYFKELVLCHKYGRYTSYANVRKYEHFDFAVRDSVFQYLAFIHVLNRFKLITPMEEIKLQEGVELTPIEELSDYQQRIEGFFDRMKYTDAQKALFYLGRVLNSVAYKQADKGYKAKPVLNKLNYNGMDKDDIVRLRKELAEKTQQYNLHKTTEYNFSWFTRYFDYNNWSMKPEEALFFILSGYSYFDPTKKKDSEIN